MKRQFRSAPATGTPSDVSQGKFLLKLNQHNHPDSWGEIGRFTTKGLVVGVGKTAGVSDPQLD